MINGQKIHKNYALIIEFISEQNLSWKQKQQFAREIGN